MRALLKHGLVHDRLLACDASATRVSRLADLADRVRATVDDVERLRTIEPGSVDFFISSQVIEHVDDERMLNAIANVTRPGSIVYLSTVQKHRYAWYFHRSKAGWALDPTHLREYVRDAELLDKVDFRKFKLRENVKTPLAYSLSDLLFRAIGSDRKIYSRSALSNRLRALKLHVPGYSIWELVLERL